MEKEKLKLDPNEIHFVCEKCGNKHGKYKCGIATWHLGICDICGNNDSVTEIRDYGYLANDTRKKMDI